LNNRADFLTQLGAGLAASGWPRAFDVAQTADALTFGVRPGDPDYDRARQDNNARLDFHPDLIAFCENLDDVSQTLRWATANGKSVTIRSGGHDYEGFSLNDGGVVVDLSRYSGIHVLTDGKTATIRAGTTLRDMYHGLAQWGRTLAGGTCPSVGVTGLTTGGGYGMLVRQYGLMCDRLRRVTIIDAEGRVRDSSTEERGTDILWACSGGGGGSFGVVTDLEFDLIESPKTVTYFLLKWKWDAGTAAEVLARWMSWGTDAPRELSSGLTLQGGSGKSMHVIGLFLGDVGALTPILDTLSKGTRTTESVVKPMNFIDAVDTFAGPYSPRQPWKKKSSFGAHALSADGIAEAIHQIEAAPHRVTCVLSFDNFGGAVNDLKPSDTAFPHRDMCYLLQYQAYWETAEQSDAALVWVKSAFAAIDPHTSMKSYRNYSDVDLADWQRRYFGENYPRLRAIKKRLDPHDLFRFPQSIELP
jgi:FAD/FMN-containing dehydrogenase